MTAGLPIRPAPAAFRISTASPILLHPSLFTVFRVVPTLVSHENDSQKTRVSSLAGMEVEPSTWYSSRVTLPSHDLAHWRLTSQPCLCSNHHSTWAHWDEITVKLLHHTIIVIFRIGRRIGHTSNIGIIKCFIYVLGLSTHGIYERTDLHLTVLFVQFCSETKSAKPFPPFWPCGGLVKTEIFWRAELGHILSDLTRTADT